MNELIAAAILQKRRLRFTYDGRERLVEPQCYGVGSSGNELLRCYQLQGGAVRECLFEVDKIGRLQLLHETFRGPGPHYRRDDSAMRVIFCQL